MKIYDVTVTIREGMPVYPGDPEVGLKRVARLEDGAPANVSLLTLGTHTGTHVDPPFHFKKDGITADGLSLDAMVGPALVVRAGQGEIGRTFLEGVDLGGVERLLFKGNSASLTEGAAIYLSGLGIGLVGVEGPSVDREDKKVYPAHDILLGKGVIILEGLDLSTVAPGRYELICLPLKIKGGDGAPARVILRETT